MSVKQEQSSGATQDGIRKHKLVEMQEPDPLDLSKHIPLPVQEGVKQIATTANKAFLESAAFVNENIPKVIAFYKEVVEPYARPVIAKAQQYHEEYPQLLPATLSLIALIFGGSFPNMALLFTAWQVAGTQAVVNDVKRHIWDKLNADRSLQGNISAILEKNQPKHIEELLARLGIQVCVFFAARNSHLVRIAVLGCYLAQLAEPQLAPRTTAQLKALGLFTTEDGIKTWIPYTAQWVIRGGSFIFTLFFPALATTLVVGFEGGARIAKQLTADEMFNSFQTQTMAWLLAIAMSLCQWMLSYRMTWKFYYLFFPLLYVESLL